MLKILLPLIISLTFLGCTDNAGTGSEPIVEAAPTLSDLETSVSEGLTPGRKIAQINILDTGSAKITKITLSGTGSSTFDVSTDGSITLDESAELDYEEKQVYNLSAVATNLVGDSKSVSVVIEVIDVDEVAILKSFSGSISEDATPGIEIGTIEVESIGDSNITEMSLEGTGHENFSITVDGVISTDTNLSLDYETLTQYKLTAYATNHGGKSAGSDVIINVVNVPDQLIVLQDTTLRVDENASADTIVGSLIFLNPGDSNITSITLDGEDSDKFKIDTTGQVTVEENQSLDYEDKNLYSFSVAATNILGTSESVELNITINDIPDIVPSLKDTDLSVEENSLADTKIGSIALNTEGDTSIISYTLLGDGKENFDVSADGVVSVASGAVLDYEKNATYNLEIYAKNSAGNSDNAKLKVTILDVENPFQIAKIQANDSDKDDMYAKSVAISNEYIIVGTPNNNISGSDTGSIYLLKRASDDSITQIDSIEADDAKEKDLFGYSVAIDGDYIVVGAPLEEDGDKTINSGAAYLFKIDKDSLKQIAKFYANDAEDYDYFGHSVAINGNYIVVGANEEDTDAEKAGSAYVFKINSDDSVTQIEKIQADSPSEEAYFGESVAIYDNFIVVGSYGENDSTGSAYLFKIDADDVTQTDKITANDGEKDDLFGKSLSIFKNYVVIGAMGEDSTKTDAGSAYLYEIKSNDTADELTKIQADDAQEGAKFGNTVSLHEKYIAIGSYLDDASKTDTGSAYLFKIEDDEDVTQVKKMVARYNHAYDNFANSIAIFENIIVVGGALDDTLASNGGSAYVFNIEPIDKPYIYNVPKYKKVNEELTYTEVQTIDAQRPNGGAIIFDVEGDDADLFTIEDNILSFVDPINYEDKSDKNGDNSFDISVVASTSLGTKDTKHTYITVQDLEYLTLATTQAKYAEENDAYSTSVAVSGDYILVGAPNQDEQATNAGCAYLYKKLSAGRLVQIATIYADDAEVDDHFGASVSLDGDYLAIGAPTEDTTNSDAGSVYIFKRNSDDEDDVSQLAHLQSNDADADDYFGTIVKIDSDYIAIGANGDDETKSNAGSAYLFKRSSDDNITQIAKFQADDADENDSFASTLSIDGDYIVVSSKYNDDNGSDSGSGYLFKRESDDENNVTQIAKFTADDAEESDHFGESIAIDGNYIVVGAPDHNISEGAEGQAYLFKKDSDDNVTQISAFTPDDIEQNDNYATSIAIDDDIIVVGSIKCDTIDNEYITKVDSGCSYTFKRKSDTDDGVKLIEKSQARVPQVDSNFGNAIDIDGDLTVVGADATDNSTGTMTTFIKDND